MNLRRGLYCASLHHSVTRDALQKCGPSSHTLTPQWSDPRELHGIGQYGADAYLLFCRGRWLEVQPADKDLRRYHEWLRSTGGLGQGLERESLEAVLAPD